MKTRSKIWTALLFLIVVSQAFGQGTVALNGSVIDQDGIGWIGGSWRAQLQYSGGQAPYNTITRQYVQTLYQGYMGTGGSMSVTITDTNDIFPAGTTWQFTFCPSVYGISCGQPQLNIPVTAASAGSFFSQVTAAIPPPRISGGQNSFAYADVEVAATPNNSYQNTLTAPGLRCYTGGVGWAPCGGGGGGGASFPSTQGVVYNLNTTSSRNATAADISGLYGYTPLNPMAIPITGNVLKGSGTLGLAEAATPGTDYVIPSGNVATATALQNTPGLCNTGFAPIGILPNGNATGCAALSSGSINYNQGSNGAVTRTSTSKWQDSISIKDFGATGGNLTLDTAGLQNAVAAAAQTGKSVYIPAGSYLLNNSSGAVLSGANNVLIWGDGPASSLACNTVGGADCLASTGATGFGLANLSVSFTPSATTRSSGYAVNIETCTGCMLENVSLNNGDLSGLRLASSTHTSIHNLQISNFYANGIFAINDQDLRIEGLACSLNQDACLETSWYDSEFTAHSIPCEEITATNIVSQNDLEGILVNSCRNVSINGFAINGSAKEAIFVGQDPTTTTAHWPDRIQIGNGTIYGAGYGTNPIGNTVTAEAILVNVGTNPSGAVSNLTFNGIAASHISGWGYNMADFQNDNVQFSNLKFYDVGNAANSGGSGVYAGCVQTEGNIVNFTNISCADVGTYALFDHNALFLTGTNLVSYGANQQASGTQAVFLDSTATGYVGIYGVSLTDTNASAYTSAVFDDSTTGQHRIDNISSGSTQSIAATGPTSNNSGTTFTYSDATHSYVLRNGGTIESFAPPNVYLVPTAGTTGTSQVNGAVFYYQSKCRVSPPALPELTESVGWYDWYPTLTTESFAFNHTGGCGFPIVIDLTAASAVDSPPLNAQSVSSGNINGVMYPAQCANTPSPSWCSGTTADAWIRAACSALPSSGGKVDLTGLTGTVAAPATCSTTTKHVDMFADNSTNLTVTESDGAIPFPIDNGSSFTGPGYGQCFNGAGIHLSSSTNITALVGPAHVDGSQENFGVHGLCVYGATGATVSQGLFFTEQNYANTTFSGNNLFECNTACIKSIDSGDVWIENNWANVTDGNYSITGSPLIIQGSGSSAGCSGGITHVSGGRYEHANGGGPEILVEGNGAGGTACSVGIRDLAIERNTSGTPSTIGIQIKDCWQCTVDNVIATGSAGGSDMINISQTAFGLIQNVVISNIMVGGPYTNGLNDTTPGGSVLTAAAVPQITYYPSNPGYIAPAVLAPGVLESVGSDVMNGLGSFSTGNSQYGTDFSDVGCQSPVTCTITRTNATAPPGSTYSQSIQVTANTDPGIGYNGLIYTPTVSFTAGQTYVVNFWGKSDGTFPGVPTFLISDYIGHQYCLNSASAALTSTWTLYSFSCTPSASATSYLSITAATPGGSTGTFWLGGFTFAPVQPLTPGSLLASITPYGVGDATDAQKTITINGTPCELDGTCSISGGGSMTWPSAAGIAVYGGSSAWGTSLTAPSGTIVGTSDTQTLTNKTLTAANLGTPTALTLTNATGLPWSGLSGSPSTAQVPVQSITTTGSSGASTLSGGVLNIPQYAGSSTIFQANGTGLTSSTTVNFENSAATNGLTLTFGNPSAGNVQLGFTGTLTNAGLANSATTVNSQTCTLGSSCTIPFQTNSSNNTSQAGLNLLTSTANSVGLTVTPTNSGTNQEKFEVTGASYTGTASNGVFAHTLSGATPTTTCNSATVPATDANFLLMSANVTSFTLCASSAVANGEVLRVTVQQGASVAYTLPTGTANSPFTAGSGTTLVNTVPTGCPTIGATTGSVTPSEIFYVLQYHTALTEWELLGCNTTVAQTAIIEAPIQSSGTFGGTAINTVVASISPTHSGTIANLVIVNTNASSNCTTAPTFNVFDGTTNVGTAKIGITTAQTKGNATTQSQSLAFNAGDIIGIYISTAGATCTVPVWSVSAMITEP